MAEPAVADERDPPGAGMLGWGIGLGLLLVVGDAVLIPGEQGLSVGAKLPYCLAVAFLLAGTLRAWGWDLRPSRLWGGAAALGVVAAVVSGDWFGPEAPAWRDLIVPITDLLVLTLAAVTWYAGRRGGEFLLLAGATAAGLVVYGQQNAPLWSALAGVGATLLLLVPAVSGFSRVTLLVVHALALLGLVQTMPSWFSWTPFPFLSLIPLYVAAMWWRDGGLPRRVAWWSGAVVGGGTFLLGTSTLVGGLRKDLPLGDSWVMLGIGGATLALFYGLHRLRAEPALPALA